MDLKKPTPRPRARTATLYAIASATASLCAIWQLVESGPESNVPTRSSPPGSHGPSSVHSLSHAGNDVFDLIRTKPREALRLASQLEDTARRNELLGRSIAEWSTRDGNAALRWIAKLGDPVLRDDLRSIALVHFADYDPVAAAEILATQLPQGQARDRALGPLYQRWAQRDPDAAWASALMLADPSERNCAMEQIIRQIACDDPSAAIRLLIKENLADSSPDLLEELAGRWAVRDQTAAREWVGLLAEGEVRDRLLKQVALVFAREKPTEAAEWVLESISPGMTQDEAILAVLGEWLLSDIDSAGRWATTFPPGPLRSQAESEVQKAILRRKPL